MAQVMTTVNLKLKCCRADFLESLLSYHCELTIFLGNSSTIRDNLFLVFFSPF